MENRLRNHLLTVQQLTQQIHEWQEFQKLNKSRKFERAISANQIQIKKHIQIIQTYGVNYQVKVIRGKVGIEGKVKEFEVEFCNVSDEDIKIILEYKFKKVGKLLNYDITNTELGKLKIYN
jgi:hypothetical protein